ncbi:MAG: oxidoreductase [Cyanobacteria bacterium REEB65]|nr:oxidoreductase [Cyanobacteria bacterium REEB65]
MTESFNAVYAQQDGGPYRVDLRRLHLTDLPAADVLVQISYSSLNYKDGLAVTGQGKIARKFPMVLGIDLAGTVIESRSERFKPGDRVLGIGQTLSETQWGGYSQFQRVSSDILLPIPARFGLRDAMAIGTAGFTAMLCVMGLEQQGVVPGRGPVLVTGAGGGVGSYAIALLAKLGHEVVAVSGRPELESYLAGLGAARRIPRSELEGKGAPLQSQRWAGGVDTVGGEILVNLIAQTQYEGAVAACGMAAGSELSMSVFPFILRNVALLGTSSSATPRSKRLAGWDRLAAELPTGVLEKIAPRTEPLTGIFELSHEILAGKIRGRIVIDVNS